METTRGRARWLTRINWVVILAIMVLAVPAIASATPTAPTMRDATVSEGGTSVTVWWSAPTDTLMPNTFEYKLYRDTVPMTVATASKLILTTTETTVTVPPAAGEAAAKFTYYYAVEARNTSVGGTTGPISTNIAPNVHGGMRSDYPVYNCQLCHNVHGVGDENYLGAATRYKCYRCHGATDATKSYGDKAVRNVQKDFFDYTSGQTIPGAVSRHYNDFMENAETECTACHTPHKSPYYVNPANGAKVPASSYTQLLRVETTVDNYFYGRDDYVAARVAPASGNDFCLQCHGASGAALDLNAGTGVWGATAGNHDYAANAAHDGTVIYSNQWDGTSQGNPGIQCEACHNKHASPVKKLIDYRASGTTATENDQAGLCFKCHKTGGEESLQSPVKKVAAASPAPYAWNLRSVYDEFRKPVTVVGGTSHPTAAGSGDWFPTSGDVFSQTTDIHFNTDTKSNVTVNTADGNGSVVLGGSWPQPPYPAAPYVLVSQAASTGNTDSYGDGDASWNLDFNPTSIGTNPAAYATSTTKNGIVFALQGNGSQVIRTYTPPANSGTGTWGTTANGVWGASNAGLGSDMAYDSDHDFIWTLIGGFAPNNNDAGTNIRRTTDFDGTALEWNNPGDPDGPAFMPGGTTRRALGAGAALVWVPGVSTTRNERLYVISRNGNSSQTYYDGDLWYYDNPDDATGSTAWADSNVNVGSPANNATVDSGTRMAWFRIGTTDYIYALRGAANREVLVRVNADGTHTTLDAGTANPWDANIGEGCSLVWNGDTTQAGFRLYATQGGNIGRSFKVATWNGTALVWSNGPDIAANSTTGTYLSYVTADPADPAAYVYSSPGSISTEGAGDATIPSTKPISWDSVTFTKNQPANTALTVTVQGWNGTAWIDLATSGTSPITLGAAAAPVATYSKLRLRANLSTTNTAVTPRLDAWSVQASWQKWVTGEYVPGPATTAFSQPSPTAFASPANNTLSQTQVSGSTIVLNTYPVTPTIDPPAESYLFAHDGGTQVLGQYLPADNAWNTNNLGNFTPPVNGSFNTGIGSQLFTAGGKVYVARGSDVTLPMIRAYTPPAGTGTGSWANTALTTAFDTDFGPGSQATVNAGSSVVYISGAGNDNNINWWNYPNNSKGSFNFSGNLGIGSAIAYAPGANRLFVINRNGNSSTYNGQLYSLPAPAMQTGTPTWTASGRQVTDSGGTTYYNRLAHFRDGAGVEYLMMIGMDTGDTADTVIVGNLTTGTLTAPTFLNISPFGAALGDGCDLVWDGVDGGYLYAIQGGASAEIRRIRIPAATALTAGNWGTWETLTDTPWTQNAGAGITFAMADPPSYTGATTNYYYLNGTVKPVADISPAAGSTTWGSVAWTETLPANTDITITVQGGSGWTDLKTSGTSPIDLSSYTIADYPKLRLIATLTTSNPASTPVLTGWTVTSTKPVFKARGSVTCVNCHNVHTVGKGTAGTAWQLARVSDPDNTKLPFTGAVGDFCLRCHDGQAPTAAVPTDSTLVPYTVGFTTYDLVASPFFWGDGLWNKEAQDAGWTASTHNAVGAIANDCGTCHDPHASNFDSLTAFTGGASTRANTNAAVSKEENLCYAANGCHNSSATGTKNVQSPMATTYSHTAENTADEHTDTEGPAELGPAGDRHSECADCHDPHAARAGVHANRTSTTAATKSSEPGEALRGATGIVPAYATTAFSGKTGEVWETMNRATGFETERMTGEGTDFEAYVCLKCHSSYSGQPFALTAAQGNGRVYTSTDLALEFNPSNQSEHNVMGQKVGMEGSFTVNGATYTMPLPADADFLKTGWTSNSPVTCTDCHDSSVAGQARGPHGSTTPWMMATGYVSWTATTDLSNMGTTVICAKCHQNLSSANSAHNKHSNRADCWDCHITIPHGWKRPRLLNNENDPEPYERGDSLIGGGITLRNRTGPDDWRDGSTDCAGGCDNRHNATGPFWP